MKFVFMKSDNVAALINLDLVQYAIPMPRKDITRLVFRQNDKSIDYLDVEETLINIKNLSKGDT